MSPIDKLIRLVDNEICYTISELVDKCRSVGIEVTRSKFYHDIQKGKLRSTQLNGFNSDHQITGSDFLANVLPN